MKEFAKKYLDLLTGEFAGINLTRIESFDEFYQKQIIDSVLPQKESAIFSACLSETKIMVIEARATAGLDKLEANQTGVLVYVVDTSIPTIKGIAKTYSCSDVNRSLRDAPLKRGESITVEGISIKAGSAVG